MTRRAAVRANLAIGATMIGLVALAALASLFWLPADPRAIDFSARFASPSAAHPLGADHFGRDLLARLLVGARLALLVGVASVGTALTTGSLLGAAAGFAGGIVDDVVMRLVETLYAFPALLMALLLSAALGPGTGTAMLAIGLATIPIFARIARAGVLQAKGLDHAEAARALGAGPLRLLLRHLLPQAASPIVVQASLSLAVAVLAEAALSFLGLGTPEGVPSWGNMLREAQGFLAFTPWPVLVPGLAIVWTVLGFGLLGDGLRDRLDPRRDG